MTRQWLDGRVVLVTGAARRIGARIARELHSAGANLALHYRHSAAEAKDLHAELEAARPGSAAVFAADLGDIAALENMIEEVRTRFGGLDALVNNASSFFSTPLGEISAAQWNALFDSNLKGPLFLAQAAAPLLRERGGAIVNITDVHAERPLAGYAVYCAAKAGLAGLTRALAIELAPEVRVNGVAPGPIEWPDDGSFDAATREAVIADTLLKRRGDPADIARTVRFLLADAPYVTGQILAVDGGRTTHL